MFRFKQLLGENAEEIVRLVGEEHDKISHDAQGGTTRSVYYLNGMSTAAGQDHPSLEVRNPLRF